MARSQQAAQPHTREPGGQDAARRWHTWGRLFGKSIVIRGWRGARERARVGQCRGNVNRSSIAQIRQHVRRGNDSVWSAANRILPARRLPPLRNYCQRRWANSSEHRPALRVQLRSTINILGLYLLLVFSDCIPRQSLGRMSQPQRLQPRLSWVDTVLGQARVGRRYPKMLGRHAMHDQHMFPHDNVFLL